MEMLPHQLRIINELKELDEKVGNLRIFIEENPIFDTLLVDRQDRLRRQLEVMTEYSQILNDRIAEFTS